VQTIPSPIALKITKHHVLVEVCNPMMEHLIVELIKTQFLIAVVIFDQIDLIVLYRNATKPQLVTLFSEPFDEFHVKRDLRGGYFVPLELTTDAMMVAQFVYALLESSSFN